MIVFMLNTPCIIAHQLDITGWVGAHQDRVVMAQKRAMIVDRDRVRAEADRILSLPDNRTTRDQSRDNSTSSSAVPSP